MTTTPAPTAKSTYKGSTAERKAAFEDGMNALREAQTALAVARNAFASLDRDDPAHWLDDECCERWLGLRRLLIKIENGEV